MKRPTFLLGMLLLVSLLVACSNGAASAPASSTTQTVPVSTPTPTRQVIASALVGTYSTTITRQDVASVPDRNFDVGVYKWSFYDDGIFNWLQSASNGDNTGNGQYQVSQRVLSILTDPSCTEVWNAPTGTYSWVLKGNMLILQAKDDGCLDRKFVLTTHPLLRQSP